MRQQAGGLFLIVFGAAFLCVGLGMGFFSARTLARAQAMLAWRETPATVLVCDLRSETDSDGGTTYQATAAYRYDFGGVRYTGSRVSMHSGADNIGDFHRRAYAQLTRCKAAGTPAACWVNPLKPAESVLFRKPRPELIALYQVFVLAFGGAGLAVLIAGGAAWMRRARATADDGLIRMSGASTHRALLAVAAAWNAYAAWLLWTLGRVLAPDRVPWYLWLLAAAGALLAALAAYWGARFRKYGVSVIALSPAPGRVGGPVAGTLRIPAPVEAPEGFGLRLQCFHRYTTQSGGDSSTTTECCWEARMNAVAGAVFGDETMVPVRFAVPQGLPETAELAGGERYFWRLTAAAKTPGVDYKAVFDVPVRRGPRDVAAASASPAVSRERAAEVVRRLGLRLEARPDGGFELACPAARPSGLVGFLLVFTAAWSGACCVLWFAVQAPLVFSLVFSLFDLLLVLLLGNALLVSRGIVVDRSRRECVVWRRVFGLRAGEAAVPFDEAAEFRCERSGTSGSTVYFRLVLKRRHGAALTVADYLKGWGDADGLSLLLTAAVLPDFRSEGFRV